MPEVNVEINGRKYRMACQDGQEAHLMGLAERFNRQVDQFKDEVGEIGDNRLTVMAGIAVLDELAEAERRIADLTRDVEVLRAAGADVAQEAEALERVYAGRLNEAAAAVEALASVIEESAGVAAG